MRDLASLADALMPVVERASTAIMQIYDGAFAVQRKDDNSPLTLADLESQRVIIEGLKRLTPEIPVLSEESAAAPWAERQTWRELWVFRKTAEGWSQRPIGDDIETTTPTGHRYRSRAPAAA